jgi:fluoride exporter
MEPWYQVAVLSVGGALGVNARYWLGVVISRWTGSQFPWATLTINVTGSFAIGLFMVALARWLPHPHARLLVVVGFLGGYTTFSSFSFESLALWERGEHGLCLTYMVGSVAAGFAAVVLGTALGRGLTLSAGERAAPGDRAPVHAGARAQPAPGLDGTVPPALANDPGSPADRPATRASVPKAGEPGASS